MDQVGEMLREARQRQGITFDQVEEEIMIKKRYLEAMENEEWSKLPGKVYAKGFLRSYARYLKLNEQAVIDLYDVSSMAEAAKEKLTNAPAPAPEPRRKIELNSKPKKNMIIVFCIVSVLLLYGAQWVYNEYLNPPAAGQNDQGGQETPQLPNEEPVQPPAQEEPAAQTPAVPKNTIDLVVLAQEEACWLRLRDGDNTLYEGTLKPGEKVEFTDIARLNVRAGNAGAIQVTINGTVLEPIGDFNQVVTKTFVVENDEIIAVE